MTQPLPETLLRQRAQTLAAPRLDDKTTEAPLTLMTLHVDEETYAVPAEQVIEVVTAPQTTHLPGQPDALRGVFNYRGRLLAHVDLGCWLGHPPAEPDHLLILQVDSDLFGLSTGVLGDTLSCDPAALDPRVDPYTTLETGRFTGVLMDEGRPVLVVNLNTLTEHIKASLSGGHSQ